MKSKRSDTNGKRIDARSVHRPGARALTDVGASIDSVFGTPAEELFGLPEPTDGRLAPGKDALFEAGAFAGVHAAMMIHPFPTPCGCILPTINYARIRAKFSKADGATVFDRHGLRALLEELKRTVEPSGQTPALFVARGNLSRPPRR